MESVNQSPYTKDELENLLYQTAKSLERHEPLAIEVGDFCRAYTPETKSELQGDICAAIACCDPAADGSRYCKNHTAPF